MHSRLLKLLAAALVAAVPGFLPSARALTNTWTGAGANNFWTTASNWNNNVAPVAGADLVFPPAAARLSNSNNFAAGTIFNSIAFSGSGFFLAGSNLVLAAGLSATHGSGVNNVFIPIQLSANQAFTNAGDGDVYFANSTIDLSGHDLTFGVGGGEVQAGSTVIVGAGAVIKTGPGSLLLGTTGKTNTYTGATEVRQGTLSIPTGSALGATNGGTTVFAGGTLNPGGTFTSSEPLILHGALNIGGFSFGTNVWNGPVSLMATNVSITVNFAARADLNGVVSGSGGLNKSGSGTLVLNATNTYTGSTTNVAGILVINGHQPQSPITLSSGTLGGTGTVGTITSAGIVAKTFAPGGSPGILNSSNVALSAFTTFAAELNSTAPGSGHDQLNVRGTVNLNNVILSALLGFTPMGAETFVLINNDGTDPVTGTFNGLPEGALLALGTNQFRVTYTGGSGNDVVLRNNFVPFTGITRTWDGGGANDFWTTPTNWAGDVTPTAGDDLVFPASMPRSLNTNNFPAGTTFNSITLSGVDYALYGANVALNAGIRLTNFSGTVYLNLPLGLNSNQTITLGSGTALYSSGAIETGDKILTFDGSGFANVASDISGYGGLIKTGAATVQLYGNNTFSGPARVLQGSLNLFVDAALGATTGDTSVSNGATLLLANPINVPEPLILVGTLVSSPAGAKTLSGPITLASSSVGISVQSGAPLTIAGEISGNGGFVKTGPESLNLTGTNSYTGGTQIQGGTVSIANSQGLGSSGAGTTVASPATLLVMTTNPIAEPLTLAGTLQSTLPPLTWTGPVTITGNAATLMITGPTLLSGLVSGAGNLTKTMGGLTLTANNPYSGTITNLNGYLEISGSQPASAIVLSGGFLLGNGTVGALTAIGGSPKTISPGSSPGIFSSSDVTLNSSTSLEIQLNGTTPGSGHDQLNVAGAVNLAGANLNVSLGFMPVAGDSFTIIPNDGADAVTGTFNGLAEGAFLNAGGKPLQISYAGGTGNDVVLTRVSPPTTVASITRLNNGQMLLQATGGLTGFSYLVQAATNLNPVIVWSNLGAAFPDSGGSFSFTDTNAPLFPMRFYRVRSP